MGAAGKRPEFDIKRPLRTPLISFPWGYLQKYYPLRVLQQVFETIVFPLVYELPKAIELQQPVFKLYRWQLGVWEGLPVEILVLLIVVLFLLLLILIVVLIHTWYRNVFWHWHYCPKVHPHCWLPTKVMYPANSTKRFSWLTCSTSTLLMKNVRIYLFSDLDRAAFPIIR